jgi:hypothetical protein
MQGNFQNYDIEVLTGNESEIIEMVIGFPHRKKGKPTLAIIEFTTDFVSAS